jgi:hypothetical protein
MSSLIKKHNHQFPYLAKLNLCSLTMSLAFHLSSCVPPSSQESTPEYALGSWVKLQNYNLLFAAKQTRTLQYCITPIGFNGNQQLQANHVERALHEWFAQLVFKINVTKLPQNCAPDIKKGIFQVMLFGSEAEFMRKTVSVESTLGIYYPNDGILMLNMEGVLNPNRDSSSGYKTVLHELGHGLGLHHSPDVNSVMYFNLHNAPGRLTSDDANGIRAAWTVVDNVLAGRQDNNFVNDDDIPMANNGFSNPAGSRSVPFDPEIDTIANVPGDELVKPDQKGFPVRSRARYSSRFFVGNIPPHIGSLTCEIRINSQLYPIIYDRFRNFFRVRLIKEIPGCPYGRAGTLGWIPAWVIEGE